MSRRIAIVEDEPAIRENYADVLRRQGYEVAAYANRRDALAAFRTRLPDLAVVLEKAAGVPAVLGGAIAAGVADVPRAVAQANDIVRLARILDKPPGAYVLRDVLLEYQLTRPSDAQEALSGLIEPLDRNPDLLRTIEAYLDNDLDRRRTAAALHVHPNTFDYRLRRIIELTGLDPATTHGLQLLGAALAARRLTDGPGT